MSDLPDEAYGAALVGLPAMTPLRLREVLRKAGPMEAWLRLAAGDRAMAPDRVPKVVGRLDAAEVLRAWRDAVAARDARTVWERVERLGLAVHLLGRPGYPAALADDAEAPAVLFSRGDLAALDGPRVAIVGTRNPTLPGREMTAMLAVELARHDVRVVSGLARGIDGQAHRAVLAEDGVPIGVVASGLDVVYPTEHEKLWEEVAEHGVLLSESPPGTAPEAHRFPARNRIIAALASLVVVVESRAKGGSLITAAEAEKRGIDVVVVPGSPRNPAAEGTNRLAQDGAGIVLDPLDVLVRLNLVDPSTPVRPRDRRRAKPSDEDAAVLACFSGDPLDLDALVRLSGRPLGAIASTVARLEHEGWLRHAGGFFERAAAR